MDVYAAIIAFNLIMALWRSPVISLMPDVTPPPLRSQANGIINLMGGVGTIIAFLVGGYLSDLREDNFYAFFMVTIVMVVALIILLLFIREPDSITYREENNLLIRDNIANRWAINTRQQFIHYREHFPIKDEPQVEKQKGLTAFLSLSSAHKISFIAILIAIFAWFLGFNAIETFFTLYATNTYEISGGQASMMLTGFSLSFLIFAIPAGLLAQRLGRKRTILIGIIGIMLCFFPILTQPSQLLLQILLIAGGAFWSLININSLPMVLEFGSERTIGSFTGYYYLFSFTAAIVSPILYGFIQDFFQTNELLFSFALICFGIALVSMLFVRHGEDGQE